MNTNFVACEFGNRRVVCDLGKLEVVFEEHDEKMGWHKIDRSPLDRVLVDKIGYKFSQDLCKLIESKGVLKTKYKDSEYQYRTAGTFVLTYLKIQDAIGEAAWAEVYYHQVPKIHIFIFFCKLAGFQPIFIGETLAQGEEEEEEEEEESAG